MSIEINDNNKAVVILDSKVYFIPRKFIHIPLKTLNTNNYNKRVRCLATNSTVPSAKKTKKL